LFLLPHGGFPSIYCPFELIFNTPCPACGLSHSAACLINGQVSQSFTCHPLGIILILFLIFAIITNHGIDTNTPAGKLIYTMIIALFLITWIFRVII
jgi:hypothetical protein